MSEYQGPFDAAADALDERDAEAEQATDLMSLAIPGYLLDKLVDAGIHSRRDLDDSLRLRTANGVLAGAWDMSEGEVQCVRNAATMADLLAYAECRDALDRFHDGEIEHDELVAVFKANGWTEADQPKPVWVVEQGRRAIARAKGGER